MPSVQSHAEGGICSRFQSESHSDSGDQQRNDDSASAFEIQGADYISPREPDFVDHQRMSTSGIAIDPVLLANDTAANLPDLVGGNLERQGRALCPTLSPCSSVGVLSHSPIKDTANDGSVTLPRDPVVKPAFGREKKVATYMLHRELLLYVDNNLLVFANSETREDELDKLVDSGRIYTIEKLGNQRWWRQYDKSSIKAAVIALVKYRRVRKSIRPTDFWTLGSEAIKPQYLQLVGFYADSEVSLSLHLEPTLAKVCLA